MIRIGGQSHSTILEGKNLRLAAKEEAKTKSEGYCLATTYKSLENQEKPIKTLLRQLHGIQKRPDWSNFGRHLSIRYRCIHQQFSVDEEGFETVGDPFQIWIKGSTQKGHANSPELEHAPIQQIIDIANRDINAVPTHVRHRLVEHWTKELGKHIMEELFEEIEESEGLRQELSNIHADVDRRVLQTAKVIGVTTSGLARNIAALQHVHAKVVICEEAGEVMEPHLLTALLPSCEYVFLGRETILNPASLHSPS